MMAGYVLYGRSGSGSMVVEAAFAEAGLPYSWQLVEKGADGAFGADLLAVNPRLQVPALVLPDGSVVTESVAILLHLADAFPAAGLAPPPGSSARAQHDRWLTFAHANLYEGILRLFYSDRYVNHPEAALAVKVAARQYVLQHFQMYEAALGSGPYHFGDKVQMLDLMIWMLASWVDQGPLAATCPKVMRQCAAVAARPALGPVLARNPD